MARIYRDDHGIAHVRADDVADLGRGQGLVTARDRTWQLEWLRRRATGTTAAVVGPTGLDWDRLARRTRIVDVARRAHAGLDEETRGFVAAFVAGVNHGLATPPRTAPELRALAVEPEPWQPWTPLAVFVAQHLLFANLGGKLWSQRVVDALGEHGGLLDAEGPLEGSNAWGVGGGRTSTGLPLVAGDPHRIIEQPGVYQQIRLACEDPDDLIDVVGFAFPGVPGTPHFAHAGEVAWGITNAMADYQDVYEVVLDPSAVREQHTELVEVAGAGAEEVVVISTDHGEVIAGGLAEGRGLALRSAVSVLGDAGFGALLPLLRSRSAEDVERAFDHWVEPVNNVVVADRGGALRYRLAGRVPVRSAGNRRGVAEATDPATAWNGWLEPLPRAAPGHDGEVVTANERRGPESEPVGAVFAPPYRADRLRALLAGRTDLAADDFASFHGDTVLDPRARLTALTADWEGWLPGWDGRMDAGSEAAATFAAWRSVLTRRIAAEPALAALREPAPDSVLAPFLDLTTRVARALPSLVAAALAPGSDGRPLGVDVVAHAVAAREEARAATAAGDGAVGWGSTHRFTPVHALGDRAPAECGVPAAALGGDTDCVRATSSYPGITDACSRGPVARYVWDLADREAGGWVVPTGAAGDPGSTHHHDQLDDWAAARLAPIVTDWDRLRRSEDGEDWGE